LLVRRSWFGMQEQTYAKLVLAHGKPTLSCVKFGLKVRGEP
jgi:hypothetical protein